MNTQRLSPLPELLPFRGLGLLLSLFAGFSAIAGPEIDFFERQVRPLLVEHCYDCHSQEAGKSKGGLLLDSRAGWQVGGDSGPAIVASDLEASLVIRAIHYNDPDLEMPPDGKLSEADIKILEEWVANGAVDTRDGEFTKQEESIDLAKGKEFWAFQSPQPSAPPPVQDNNWPQNEIDHFVLAPMEDAGIQPNSPADARTLVRRLYFDLTGLPPTPNQLEEALSLPEPTRYAVLSDRLLASQHFGETWGRHWLDLARYSESTGGGRSALLPTAWRYRNYVIDSLNNDKPFDEFVREQIAGDLLPASNDKDRAENLTATAFLVLGPKNLDLQDKELLRMNTVDEQIDTVGKVFMGLTISCARCHDHKFDPIPAADYYALAGIFRSTRTLKRSNVSTLTLRDLPTSAEHREAVDRFSKEKKALDADIKQAKAKKDPNPAEKAALTSLQTKLTDLLAREPEPIPQTLGVMDESETEDYNICIRGNVHQLGESVSRSFVSVMMENPDNHPEIPENQSGRRELADWLTSPQHPLVPRVIVNRVWAHLFGEGLVRTVDDFGTQGAKPTHPELLDYLATQFVADNWSIKRLIRRLVLTRAYQLSSDLNLASSNVDAENQLRWRMPRRRLTAEAMRDAMMQISGSLQAESVKCLFPESAQKDTALQRGSLDIAKLVNPPYRSVYIPVLREEGLNPLLRAFDFANPSFPVGRRNRSILPTQALYLMNSEFVLEQAELSAQKLLREHSGGQADDLLDQAYLTTLGRLPNQSERELARSFLGETGAGSPNIRIPAWSRLFHSLFASVDFRYLK